MERAKSTDHAAIVGAVNESSVLPDAGGRRVMNGAVGVQKLKPQADGSVLTRQRIISLLVVSNGAYLRPLRRDAGLLPMVF